MPNLHITSAASSIGLAVVVPLVALAQPHPIPQRVLSRGAMTHATAAAPRAVHDVWGAIATIRGNVLSVRVRGGRIQAVDATDAVAAGRVSAPLYVGKLVEISGSYDARRVLHAVSVTRVPRVDATTPLDR